MLGLAFFISFLLLQVKTVFELGSLQVDHKVDELNLSFQTNRLKPKDFQSFIYLFILKRNYNELKLEVNPSCTPALSCTPF